MDSQADWIMKLPLGQHQTIGIVYLTMDKQIDSSLTDRTCMHEGGINR